jgi:diguanylate cyclase (GGDEF)-like protein/PAS domain S-box-containing protein
VWRGFTQSTGNIVIFEHGPGFPWIVFTSNLMALIIIANLWAASRKGSVISRRQGRLLLYAILFPLAVNLMYLFGFGGVKGVDWTSITFSITGLLFLRAFHGSRLLDLVPIAREKLLDSLGDGMIVIDMQNRIVDINLIVEKILGISSEKLIGKDLTEVVPPLIPPLSGQPPDHEIKTEVEIGSIDKRYFDVLISPLRENNKTTAGRLIMFRDITQHKENELRLLQLTQAVEHSPTSILITDLQGNIEYVNPRFTDLTGYTLPEVLGKKTNIVKSGHTPVEVYREMWHAIKAGQTWHGEFLNKKKNGDLYWEHAMIAPVLDHDGRVLNFIAVKENITERKLAEAALRDANQKLESQLREIESLQALLYEQAVRDPLTQLHNRRYLNEAIERVSHHAQRYSETFSVIMLDIDHFKAINDRHGHLTGDNCLIALAKLIQQHCRKSDITCRYGGEEFILVLPNSDSDGAVQYAEKLRLLVSSEVFTVDALEIKLTISLGIAFYPVHGTDYMQIINKADEALYTSKHTGRDRVTVWSEDGSRKL